MVGWKTHLKHWAPEEHMFKLKVAMSKPYEKQSISIQAIRKNTNIFLYR